MSNIAFVYKETFTYVMCYNLPWSARPLIQSLDLHFKSPVRFMGYSSSDNFFYSSSLCLSIPNLSFFRINYTLISDFGLYY